MDAYGIVRSTIFDMVSVPGCSGLIKQYPEMLLYLEVDITRPRWPCNTPPRLKVTDDALALICFQSFFNVLKFGCPAVLVTVLYKKKRTHNRLWLSNSFQWGIPLWS